MKNKYYHLLPIILLATACNKKDNVIDEPKLTRYTTNEAMEAIGVIPNVTYGYDKLSNANWETDLALRFHSNGKTVTEYITSSNDSLVYDVAVRVVQPTVVGELPKIVFTPYDREQHTLLTNMEKWRSLNFLRYTTDSAVLQKGTVVFFESLGKVKYEGPQELRKK